MQGLVKMYDVCDALTFLLDNIFDTIWNKFQDKL